MPTSFELTTRSLCGEGGGRNGRATVASGRSQDPRLTLDERLKILYPMVREDETSLPRCWSSKDKFNFIGLSQNNLRVQYKGNGKSHKEASSVRATHPVPVGCGIYYFEVRIVSKGRDGYMGVGLSAQGVNMNRLPGWDKHSYGYHGDDGNSFCSSGTGQAYGPTFTTGDVIGCGLNLIDGSCFYTKNGHHLGIAFTDLPSQLFPTVGLQTPGEVVDANFGQEPFVFDIEGEMAEARTRVRSIVENFPPPGKHVDWQKALRKIVGSYLVHQGFSATAEAFALSSDDQDLREDLSSIRQRQFIQKLVLSGQMGRAIAATEEQYPGFLSLHPALHFTLKVRQFIEMVSGHDTMEFDGGLVKRMVSEDEDNANEGDSTTANGSERNGSSADMIEDLDVMTDEISSSSVKNDCLSNTDTMDVDPPPTSQTLPVAAEESGSCTQNGHMADSNREVASHFSVVNNPVRFAQLIRFGRQLQAMLHEMENVRGISSERNTKLLQDAFALLAYSDPSDSPVGWQLNPSERELVSNALNSAILESNNQPARPPLEVALNHARYVVKLMSHSNLGACAFANLDDFLK